MILQKDGEENILPQKIKRKNYVGRKEFLKEKKIITNLILMLIIFFSHLQLMVKR